MPQVIEYKQIFHRPLPKWPWLLTSTRTLCAWFQSPCGSSAWQLFYRQTLVHIFSSVCFLVLCFCFLKCFGVFGALSITQTSGWFESFNILFSPLKYCPRDFFTLSYPTSLGVLNLSAFFPFFLLLFKTHPRDFTLWDPSSFSCFESFNKPLLFFLLPQKHSTWFFSFKPYIFWPFRMFLGNEKLASGLWMR